MDTYSYSDAHITGSPAKKPVLSLEGFPRVGGQRITMPVPSLPDNMFAHIWGKSDPYHPLWRHMLDTAAVCEALLPRFGPVDGLPDAWVLYIAALQDIGKADPLFQMWVPDLARPLQDTSLPFPKVLRKFRHEARSAEWILSHLRERLGWERPAAIVASRAVRGHHGDFRSTTECEETCYSERWSPLRDALAAVVAEQLGIASVPHPIEALESPSCAGVRLAGLIVLSDWIASNQDVFRFVTLNADADPAGYWALARAEAERAVSLLGLSSAEARIRSFAPSFSHVWPECTHLRPSQRAIEDICRQGISPGLAIVEAPTGEGKTEAAVYLAECWNGSLGRSGAYIALPTMATSNQMHGRYKKFLAERRPGTPEPRLVHGMAWLIDDTSPEVEPQTFGDQDEGLDAVDWFRSAKRALLAPEGVGTVDQALMAVLNVKHGFLRLLGISSKVLIVDEVHAYDEYMSTLLKRLLGWCGSLRVPVILLSATLSHSQKRELAAAYKPETDVSEMEKNAAMYPLLTFVPLDGQPIVRAVSTEEYDGKTVRLGFHSGLLGEAVDTARLAVESVRNGGCACVLVNTVKQAQAVFRELRKIEPEDTELYLFHARFRAEQRSGIEDKVVSLFGKDAGNDDNPPRPRRAILVATQVVEQSLDLDFDVMITELAPIDLLLQRCGRLHRHERVSRPTGDAPTLHILLPEEGSFEFGSTKSVYGRELLLRTLAILHGRAEFRLPADFRRLVEMCYGDQPLPEGVVPEELLAAAAEERRIDLAKARDAANTHLIPGPSIDGFSLAEFTPQAVHESEDGAAQSYFHAQTRRGDDSRAALLLHDEDLIAAVQRKSRPDRETMKRRFRQKVNVPGRWLGDLEHENGPPWLRGHVVIPMVDGAWPTGRGTVIVDDPVLGVELVPE